MQLTFDAVGRCAAFGYAVSTPAAVGLVTVRFVTAAVGAGHHAAQNVVGSSYGPTRTRTRIAIDSASTGTTAGRAPHTPSWTGPVRSSVSVVPLLGAVGLVGPAASTAPAPVTRASTSSERLGGFLHECERAA